MKNEKTNRKGLLRSFEAVIGILAIMGIYVVFYTGQQNLPDFETVNWKLRGMETMINLDKAGQLRPYAIGNDNSTIDSKVSFFLPASFEHQVQICGATDCAVVDKNAEKMTSVDYLVAGDAANFTNKRIILYIWTGD